MRLPCISVLTDSLDPETNGRRIGCLFGACFADRKGVVQWYTNHLDKALDSPVAGVHDGRWLEMSFCKEGERFAVTAIGFVEN